MPSPLNDKTNVTPFVCGVRFSEDATTFLGTNPSNFNDTGFIPGATEDIYTSISSLKYVQTSKRTKSGQAFNQKFQFQFPNGDAFIAQRIEDILKARILIIYLTDGSRMLLGRNDYYQNTRPSITTSNNTRITQITFECNSIFPAGKYDVLSGNLLPQLFPIG